MTRLVAEEARWGRGRARQRAAGIGPGDPLGSPWAEFT
jgi:hypothetical protein